MGSCASSLEDELHSSKNIAQSSSSIGSFMNGQHLHHQCPMIYSQNSCHHNNQCNHNNHHSHHNHNNMSKTNNIQQSYKSQPHSQTNQYQTMSKCCFFRQTCPMCQLNSLPSSSCVRPLDLLWVQQFICQQFYLQQHQQQQQQQQQQPQLPITLQLSHCPILRLHSDNCLFHLNVLNANCAMATHDKNSQLFDLQKTQNGKSRQYSMDVSVARSAKSLKLYQDVLGKYSFMRNLQDINENEFYSLIKKHPNLTFPIVYTPGVGLACQNFSYLMHNPRGLFFNIEDDKGKILQRLSAHSQKNVRAIVVTDGERILGLGDLGYNGMGIPIGKMALYTAISHIPPEVCLPITLDVGTNNENFLNDPGYKGLRRPRVTGQEYDNFVEEFMQAVVNVYGKSCLIQFEDFGNKNAFRLLDKYEKNYLTFNDDIQGTASVAVAGILASLRITHNKISDNKFLFYGAGEASLGTAKLICMALQKEGLSLKDARDRIFLVDSKGLVTKGRPVPVDPHKELYAKDMPHIKDLLEVVNAVKPTALIGASAIAQAFNQKILTKMAEINQRPIIFALSNPTHKAECTAEQAIHATQNRCIFASGSPFDPVEYNGKTVKVGQGNNAYIFPGVAFGALMSQVTVIPDEVFLAAAESLASFVTKEEIATGQIYPDLKNIFDASFQVAVDIAVWFIKNKTSSLRPLSSREEVVDLFKRALYVPEEDQPSDSISKVSNLWLAPKH